MNKIHFSTFTGKRPYKNEDMQRLQDSHQEVLEMLIGVYAPNEPNQNLSFVLKDPFVTYTNPNPTTTTYTWGDGWIYLKGKIVFVKAGTFAHVAGATPVGWYWDRVVANDPAGTRIYADTQTRETYEDDYLQLRPYFVIGAQEDYTLKSVADIINSGSVTINNLLNEAWTVIDQTQLSTTGMVIGSNSNYGLRYKKVGSIVHINMVINVVSYNAYVLTVDLPSGIVPAYNPYGITWQYQAHWQNNDMLLTPFFARVLQAGAGGNDRIEIRTPQIGPFSNLPFTTDGIFTLNATIEVEP